jgi:hypothetical protein
MHKSCAGRTNFVCCRLGFEDSQYGVYVVSTLWRLEFWSSFHIIFKNLWTPEVTFRKIHLDDLFHSTAVIITPRLPIYKTMCGPQRLTARDSELNPKASTLI